jgi:hypothetical protein
MAVGTHTETHAQTQTHTDTVMPPSVQSNTEAGSFS